MNKPTTRPYLFFAASTLLLAATARAGEAAPTPVAPAPAAIMTPRSGSTIAAANEAARHYRTLGKADAPVAILEFTDLQCPYCAVFSTQTLPILRERFVDKGLLRFVSYDLPLSMHAYAVPAAVAARCAGEQGKFWEYREALFREQAQLPSAPYDRLAQKFKLDMARFTACRRDEQQVARVAADGQKAAQKGIYSTPTFVIGRIVAGQFVGEVVSGAQPIEVFAEKVQAILQEAPHSLQ